MNIRQLMRIIYEYWAINKNKVWIFITINKNVDRWGVWEPAAYGGHMH